MLAQVMCQHYWHGYWQQVDALEKSGAWGREGWPIKLGLADRKLGFCGGVTSHSGM